MINASLGRNYYYAQGGFASREGLDNLLLRNRRQDRSMSLSPCLWQFPRLSSLSLAIFLAGRWLKAVLGPIGLNILMRVMGLMVAAMGVQFMVTGVSQIFITQLAPAIR